MTIFARVKAAGRRRPILEKQKITVPDDATAGVEPLIEAIVRQNVQAYNAKTVDAPLFKYLSAQQLEDAVYTGKVGFGDRKNERNQDEEEAVENALQSYRDGLFRVLVNDEEAAPGGNITIKENDTITFIRLVMLAGRMF